MLNLPHQKSSKKIKKNLLLLIILLINYAFTQEKQLQDGTYIANNNNETIRLIVKDNKYDLAFISGTVERKKDSLILNSFSQNKPIFKLEYLVNEKNTSNKIKINIKTFGYDFYKLYVGTYNNNNEAPIYTKFNAVKFDQVVDSQSSMYNETKSFEIDRTVFIELINENTTRTSDIFKFKIPNNVAEIFIECNLREEEKFKLSGTINTSTNELTISNDGRQPLTFIPEKRFAKYNR